MVDGVMDRFLVPVGEFLTQAISWMGQALSEVSSNPELFVLVIAMPVCGFAVGLLSRLIRL